MEFDFSETHSRSFEQRERKKNSFRAFLKLVPLDWSPKQPDSKSNRNRVQMLSLKKSWSSKLICPNINAIHERLLGFVSNQSRIFP